MKTIQYVISEKCNLNCIYCNVNKQDTNVQSFNDFIDFKNKFLNDKYTLDIFGGEPLLFPDLIINIIKEIVDDNNCIKIRIPTNGTIYNDKIKYIQSFKKVQLGLSHDGTLQEKNRGLNKIYLKELNIKKAHLMVTGSNMTSQNILIEHTNYFKELNMACDITIVRDIGAFTELQAKQFCKHFDEYIKYIDFMELKNFNDIPGLIKKYLSPLLYNIMFNQIYLGCGAGINHFSYNTKFLPCTRFQKTNDEYKLNNKSQYLKDCETCEINNICGQGCIYEIIQNNGIIPELCLIYKHIIKSIKQLFTNKELFKHILFLFKKEN